MSLTLTNNFVNHDVIQVRSSFKSIMAPIFPTMTDILSLWDVDSLETKVNLLEKIMTFVDYPVVYNFLNKNQFLIPLLFEAYGEILNIFGNSFGLTLRVRNDDGFEKLYLLIGSSKSDAYELLDKLDETWWIDAIQRAKNKMNIDLEY